MSSAAVAQKRVCPLLEHETATTVLDYAPAPWVLRQCTETGFVYLENPPAYESFSEDHAWEVTSKQESERRQKAEPVIHAASTAWKKFRGRAFKRNKIRDLSHAALRQIKSPTINVLDMGCGWGSLLEDVLGSLPPVMAKRCVPHGVEISKELARIANDNLGRLGGKCIHDNALDGVARFPKDYFDLIVMSSFLEHEINPLPLLRRSHERMRSGGFVVIKVPNYGCVNRRVRGDRWCGFRWPDHVNYFTPETLKAMVERAGFKVWRLNFMPFSDTMYAVLQKP